MNTKKLFLIALVIGILFAFASAPTPASAQTWEGWGSGKVTTSTDTYLNASTSKSGGCGDACSWGSNSFMSASQDGSLKISGSGGFASHRPDDVNVTMKGGYDTGYEQAQNIPGGFQHQYGEQWASGTVTITSPH